MLAGWLFADLFLVLLLVALAGLPAHQSARPAPPPPSSSTTTTTTTTQSTAAPSPALDRTPVTVPTAGINVEALESGGPYGVEASRLVDQLNAELQNRGLSKRRVGFVLAFAPGSKDGAGIAQRRAKAAIDIVRARILTFNDAADPGEGYWGAGNPLHFTIFFFA